jgi:thiol-disulfide isomerase/thioredoxin
MLRPAGTGGGSRFARAWDAFSYKRFVEVSLTEASTVGALLTVIGYMVMICLFFMETITFFSVNTITETVMSPHSSGQNLQVTFNVTFHRLPCALITLEVSDALGLRNDNLSASGGLLEKYRVDLSSGFAVMRGRVLEGGINANSVTDEIKVTPPSTEGFPIIKNEENLLLRDDEASARERPVDLTTGTFDAFIKDNDIALVSFGASWCPWSQRLQPVLEEVAKVVAPVSHVRIGRVDCTLDDANVLCQQQHIAAFPTIFLYKQHSGHSHLHYHGERTKEHLLAFLVRAQQNDDLMTSPDEQNAGDATKHSEAMAKTLELMSGPTDDEKVDPADPGKGLKLIEAIHKAGLHAPGDAARAAAKALGLGGSVNDAAVAAAKAIEDSGRRLGQPAEKAAEEGGCDAPNGTNSGEEKNEEGGNVATAPRAVADAAAAAAATTDSVVIPSLGPKVEGCMIVGQISVKRVPGVVRFNVRTSGDGLSVNADAINTSHVVNDLRFGPKVSSYQISRLPPRTQASLHRLAAKKFFSFSYNTSHEHFLRVVPSKFVFRNRYEVSSFQYSAETSSFEDTRGPLPVVNFAYDLSPLALLVKEERKPLFHFLTNIFAIVGGVFTLMSMTDSFIHGCTSFFRKKTKNGIGKLR